MKVFSLLLPLFIKNLTYYYVLQHTGIKRILLLLIGFPVLILSIFYGVWLGKSEGGIIGVLLNLDYLLLVFGAVLKLYLWIFNTFINRGGALTSPLSFFDVKIPLKPFYITMTVIQVGLLLIVAKHCGWL